MPLSTGAMLQVKNINNHLEPCQALPGNGTSANRLLLLPQFSPPGKPAVPAKHSRDTNKARTGWPQVGNITQKGSRDGKPSQEPISHLSWGVGPPGGPRLPGRVTAAVTAGPWELRASRSLRPTTSRVRPAVIELRRHRSLCSDTYIPWLVRSRDVAFKKTNRN